MIGKTHTSASLADIFSRYSELDILASYFDIKKMPCLINSPLRKDKSPSFSLYLDKNQKVRYIDFATNEHGGLMDLLGQYWHCSFPQVVYRVYTDTMTHASVQQTLAKTKRITRVDKGQSKIEVKVRDWQQHDINYWNSYGVSLYWLKIANVFPISLKVVTKLDENNKVVSRNAFKADKYAYVFVEHKERHTQLKVYQPFNTNGFKWCSKMDSSVISLWSLMPQTGDRVVICSSLKDALCLSAQLGIPAIALQGEGYGMSETAVKELKRRFKKVFIAFDMDKPGVLDAERLSRDTGFQPVFPDLGSTKDISDFYKSLKDKKDFQKLKSLFN